MTSLFTRLPEDCTPGLKKNERKVLVKQHELVVAEHLPHAKKTAMDYSIDTVTDNYLAYEYSNNKGEGSHADYEIKRFRTTGGKNILLFSKNSDTKSTANKFDLKAFTISDTSLIESKEDFLPRKLDYSVFLKKNTPDSVKTYIKRTSLCSFDLDMGATDKIMSYIVLESDKDEKWLAGNIMLLQWTGNAFTGTLSFQK